MTLLLPTSYFPPVSYIKAIIHERNVVLEAHEHYIKQTLRNRCEIYGANGPLRLSIPVDHNNRWRLPINEIKLRNDEPWKRQHLKSIYSAYRNAPFFEFYEDDLNKHFAEEHELLFDWNLSLMKAVLKWLKIKKEISVSTEFLPYCNEEWDRRKYFEDNLPTTDEKNRVRYHQVFEERHGFKAELSCIDLIFNTGPDAINYLQ